MARYDQWRRLQGPTAERPDLLDYGKKLLAYLDNQRQLSGVQTLAIERTLADGSVVHARFDGEIPSIRVQASKGPAPGGRDTLLDGLVALPRTYASASAFGLYPETVLAPHNAGTAKERWSSYFYDATYAPPTGGGQYKTTPQGKPLFAAGLKYGGNLDWRNADETLCVTFCGPASRYFPDDEQYQPWVFYNGDIIFDASELPQFNTNTRTAVLSAAIRTSDDGPWLLVCTFEDDHSAGSQLSFFIRVYKMPLAPSTTDDLWFKTTGLPKWQAPRMAKCDAAAAVRIADLEIPQLGSYFYVPPFHFNQSATEARAIIPLWVTSPNIATDITEFVIDMRDFKAVAVNRISHGVVAETTTETTEYASIVYNKDRYATFTWPTGSTGTYTDGSYPITGVVGSKTDAPFFSTGTNHTLEIPLDTTYTKVETNTVDEFPIAVDFQKDVPAYAYMRTRDVRTTTSRTSHATHTYTPAASGTLNVSGGGTVFAITWSDSLVEDVAADATQTSTNSGVLPGIRCPHHGKAGDWLNIQGSQSGSASLTSTSSLSSSGSASGSSGTFTSASAAYASATFPNGTGTCNYSKTQSEHQTRHVVSLWYLDLRYEAAIYTTTTQITSTDISAGYTAVPTVSGNGANGGYGAASSPTTINTTTTTTDHRSFVTNVVFKGQQVDTWSGTKANSDGTVVETPAFVSGNERPNSQRLGWRALTDGQGALGWTEGQTSPEGTTALNQYNAWEAANPNPALPTTDSFPTQVNFTSNNADDGWKLWVDDSECGAAHIAGATWATDFNTAYTGRYQCYRGGWLYSMPKLEGDVSVRKWQTQISDNESVDTLTGSHHPDLIGELWPLSRCPFLTSKG